MLCYSRRLFFNGGTLFRAGIKTKKSYEQLSVSQLGYFMPNQPPKPNKSGPVQKYAKFVTYGFSVGFGVTAFITGCYFYREWTSRFKPVRAIPGSEGYILKESPPHLNPARVCRIPTDTTGMKITLYQYQTCPFCCKVRTFLDYFGFSYDVIEVNSVTRVQTKWTTYKKVPFLVIELPNCQKVFMLKDSTMIISALQSLLFAKGENLETILSYYPIMTFTEENGKEKTEIANQYFLMFGDTPPDHRTNKDIIEERKWRKWVDDVFVHSLSPNVYRTPSEAMQAFQWFEEVGNWKEHFATWERLLVIYVGSAAMYIIGKRLKKKYQLHDDVRQSLYEETNVWLKSLKKKGTNFMGGDTPNLSDLSVYGILTAIEGCDAFQDLLKNTDIVPWYNRMAQTVKQHGGSMVTHDRGLVDQV